MRIVMAFLFAGIAVAQTPTADVVAKDPSKELASLEGRLLDLAGEPLKKGILTLRTKSAESADNAKAFGAASDGQGKFLITDVPPGSYQLLAERVGYLSQSYGGKPNTFQGNTLTLTAGQHLAGLSFKLTPQSNVTGKTVDEDGDPIRASVFLMRAQYERGKRQLRPISGVTSDDQGDFKIFRVSAGALLPRSQISSKTLLGG